NRRRRQREAAMPKGAVVTPLTEPAKPMGSRLSRLPIGNFLSGQLPDHSAPPAEWTVPAELREMPEPDLDMLASPLMMEDASDAVQAVPEPAAVSAEEAAAVQEGRIEVAPADPVTPTDSTDMTASVEDIMANIVPASADNANVVPDGELP